MPIDQLFSNYYRIVLNILFEWTIVILFQNGPKTQQSIISDWDLHLKVILLNSVAHEGFKYSSR